jgi:hypothetical protein
MLDLTAPHALLVNENAHLWLLSRFPRKPRQSRLNMPRNNNGHAKFEACPVALLKHLKLKIQDTYVGILATKVPHADEDE